VRAEEISFTAPYVIIEGAYMVRVDSPLQSIAQVDQPGNRVSVADKSAYDLYLTRTLQHAAIVRAPTGHESIEMFLRDRLEVAAGVRAPLADFAKAHPGLRVIDGRFMSIEQAMATPKGRSAAWRYVSGFIEEMKASGFVARSLERSANST
jgi:polar amino acid transport system substrate-binding protein